MITDLIGWLSTAVLVATIGRQAYTQWKTRTAEGVSRWLFIGQTAASTGFIIYSALLGNVVFVISNCFILIIAIAGQIIYWRNSRLDAKSA